MTPPNPDDRDTEGVGRYLQALPSAVPRAGVADLVIERHLRRRRLRRWAPLALAAGVLLAASLEGLVSTAHMPPHPAVTAKPSDSWMEVRALDRQLQAAYVEGGSSVRLEQLWRQREAAMRQIGDVGPHVRRVRL